MKKLFLLTAILFLTACAPKQTPTAIGTGELVTPWEIKFALPDTFTSDASYEQVRSEWLVANWSRFRDELFAKEVTGWDQRFDCNKFAAAFVSFVQMEYYRQNWGTWNKGQAAAVGEFWYVPKGSKPGTGHAIVSAMTERGLVFLEPQTGRFLALTKEEQESVYFSRY
jgi:hypothetical protein